MAMQMQRGFGAGANAAPPENHGDPLLQGTGIFSLQAKEGKNKAVGTLLDDNPVWGYRHLIKRPFVEGGGGGDWRERDIRVTCFVPNDPRDHPRECLICEAALRHPDVLKRKFTANLTLIHEGEHRTKKGNVYYDLKKMLELDWTFYNAFEEQKKALGRLAPMRFAIMRPLGDPKRTKPFGDVWTPLGQIDPVRHFWNSPAVRAIMEMAMKRGERVDQQQAVTRLVTPIDYEKELNNYTPELAERFLARALARNWTASQGQGQTNYQPGPGTPQGQSFGAPTMAPGAAPDYSTPPWDQGQGQPQGQPQMQFQGGQPQYGQGQMPMQGPPQMQGPPMGQPMMQPPPMQGPPQGQPMQGPPMQMMGGQMPQGFPTGPMPLGNPPMSTMPNPTLAPQPQFTPQPQYPQAPQGQPQPQGQPNYAFETAPGWSPSFPGQPQGQAQPQPQYPQGQMPMQGPPMGQPMQMPPQGQPMQMGQPMQTQGPGIPPPPAQGQPQRANRPF